MRNKVKNEFILYCISYRKMVHHLDILELVRYNLVLWKAKELLSLSLQSPSKEGSVVVIDTPSDRRVFL